MKKVVIGIDLARRVFQLHGAMADGTEAFRRKVGRRKFPDTSAACRALHRGDGGLCTRP